MAKKKQRSQKPISDTKAFFVVGPSPHNRFAYLAARAVSDPKKEVAENPHHREDFDRLLKGMARSSE
jgi:hypothetical protein